MLLNAVAARENVSKDQLEVLNDGVANFEHIGKAVRTAKVLDKGTNRVLGITLDELGQAADFETLSRDNNQEQSRRYGKLHPALHAKLQSLTDDTLVSVVVWMNDPAGRPLVRPTIEEANRKGPAKIREEMTAREAVEMARVKALQGPLHAAIRSLKATDVVSDEMSPVIYAKIPKGQLTALQNRTDVKAVYGQDERAPLLDIAKGVDMTTTVNAAGIRGTGQNVAVIEADTPQYASTITGSTNQSACAGDHATQVAGIVGSVNTTYTGMAPAATVLGGSGADCSYADASLATGYSWARTNGARVFNHSYGGNTTGVLGTLSKWLDVQTYTYWHTNVVAAGNGGETGNVMDPAIGYNVIAVGATDDQNTVVRTDDTIASFSSSKNPVSTNNDREKPEVSAPGVGIMTQTRNGTVNKITASPGVSGTSFAAPQVAGIAGLILERNPALNSYPEVIKPMIIAATDTQFTGTSSTWNSRVGAGGVNAYMLYNMAPGSLNTDNAFWENGIIMATNTSSNPKVHQFIAGAGQRVKVAMSFIVYDWTDYQNRPSADLDISITGPTGASIGGSYTWDNNTEYYSFIAPTTGAYKVNVSAFRYDVPTGFTGYYGVAVSY